MFYREAKALFSCQAEHSHELSFPLGALFSNGKHTVSKDNDWAVLYFLWKNRSMKGSIECCVLGSALFDSSCPCSVSLSGTWLAPSDLWWQNRTHPRELCGIPLMAPEQAKAKSMVSMVFISAKKGPLYALLYVISFCVT